jgi:hypothetical protein
MDELAPAGLDLGARLATVGVLLYFSPWGELPGCLRHHGENLPHACGKEAFCTTAVPGDSSLHPLCRGYISTKKREGTAM